MIEQKYTTYPIKEQLLSQATRIIFTVTHRTKQPICLKMWRDCQDDLYDTNNIMMHPEWLLEGLCTNRRWTSNVYLGVAEVFDQDALIENAKEIHCGKLLRYPKESDLVAGKSYAIFMEQLQDEWQLSHKLVPDALANKEGMVALGQRISQIHQLMPRSPEQFGTSHAIKEKLKLNRKLLNETLRQLSDHGANIEKYKKINPVMKKGCREYKHYFTRRWQTGHVKRCHGDLKASNLWIPQMNPLRLMATDCIDFNPQFCHIDTLSDMAMLAVDLEMHLLSLRPDEIGREWAQGLTQHFIASYLEQSGEQGEEVQPLLEYYKTEKAMVCAYMSVYPDQHKAFDRCERYLDIALIYAKKVEKRLSSLQTVHDLLQNPSGY